MFKFLFRTSLISTMAILSASVNATTTPWLVNGEPRKSIYLDWTMPSITSSQKSPASLSVVNKVSRSEVDPDIQGEYVEPVAEPTSDPAQYPEGFNQQPIVEEQPSLPSDDENYHNESEPLPYDREDAQESGFNF